MKDVVQSKLPDKYIRQQLNESALHKVSSVFALVLSTMARSLAPSQPAHRQIVRGGSSFGKLSALLDELQAHPGLQGHSSWESAIAAR